MRAPILLSTILSASIMLGGCANSQLANDAYYRTFDFEYDVREQSIERIDNSFKVQTVTIHREPVITMEILRFETEPHDPNAYFLYVTYEGSSWLFMEGDIIIEADGDVILRSTDGVLERDTRRGGVKEIITARVSDDQMAKMAAASSIRIQYFAEPATISEQGKANITQFYREYPL